MMKKELIDTHKHHIVAVLAAYCLVLGFLLFTNPESLPLPLLMMPFILLLAAFYMTWRILLKIYFSNLGKQARVGLALGLSGLPVLLLILQSIGQLSLRDVLVTVGLVAGLVIYFKKTDFLK